MDVNPTNLATLDTMVNTAFNERLTGVETTYGRVAMTVGSTSKSMDYPKLSELPAMREFVGSRHINRLDTEGFTVVNRKFENTLGINRDHIEDDTYGIFGPVAADLGQTAAELPDDLVWEQLASGFDVAHYDGSNFFDADHPVEDEDGVERSVSNIQTGAGPAWFLLDVSRMIRPLIFQNRRDASITAKTNLTDDNVFDRDEFLWGADRRCASAFGAWQLAFGSTAALTAENYEAARVAMGEMRGHRGRKLKLMPSLLVVPQRLEGAARDLLVMERINGGDTNKWRGTAELHVETRL